MGYGTAGFLYGCVDRKEFTVDLAAMITGNKHVEHMLAQGMEIGNFLKKWEKKTESGAVKTDALVDGAAIAQKTLPGTDPPPVL